jgi:hypothetical protein
LMGRNAVSMTCAVIAPTGHAVCDRITAKR